jgi:hypothetical protein
MGIRRGEGWREEQKANEKQPFGLDKCGGRPRE